ncbi:galactokinase [Clostridia bacterium]|nr:galactokinase [Clostridia bacterium]
MIITKTPFRMSFFGGGTDFPDFFHEHTGAVISTTFDKYCYVHVRHLPAFFEYSTELSYSKTERVTSREEIKHPAIRECMKYLDLDHIRLTYEADLPARSGLGTSSSFASGMILAFYALQGKYIDKKRLADEAIYLERTLCQEVGGIQDQIAVAFGGFNRIDMNEDGYSVRPLIISPKRKQLFNENLLMFFTGFTRFSSEIQSSVQQSQKEKNKQLLEILSLVNEAENIFTDETKSLTEIGRLLDYTWKLKRGIAKEISTDSLDEIYHKAMQAGALGGKLLGAGGGGFFIFYVEEDKQEKVKESLKDLLLIPVKFENQGSEVIHYSPE